VKDELIVTEMIFENVLTPLTPSEIVAVLSTLIFEEKDAGAPKLTDRLEDAKTQIQAIAKSLANIQIECGLQVSVTEIVNQVNVGMMEVVYEWARQMVIGFNLLTVAAFFRHLQLDECVGRINCKMHHQT
jgi:antiviral helicase SKI2